MSLVVPLTPEDIEWLEHTNSYLNDPSEKIRDIVSDLRGRSDTQSCTKMPLLGNFNPDKQELLNRLAVHLLSDATGEVLVIKSDRDYAIYLVAMVREEDSPDDDDDVEPRPAGTVEYQVSDGPPGKRFHTNDFYTLNDALKHYDEVINAGGWGDWAAKRREGYKPE